METMDNDPDNAPGARGSQATIMWGIGEQVSVDIGQGPQPVDDIGAALQTVLDAYADTTEGAAGKAGFMQAFSRDATKPERAMTPQDRAGAMKY